MTRLTRATRATCPCTLLPYIDTMLALPKAHAWLFRGAGRRPACGSSPSCWSRARMAAAVCPCLPRTSPVRPRGPRRSPSSTRAGRFRPAPSPTSPSRRPVRHLALPERRPVDVGLARIDPLVHQPAGEVLHPAVDLAVDERGRHRERHALGQLLQQVVAQLPLRGLGGLGLEIGPDARVAAPRATRTRPDPWRTRRRGPAPRAA
jgi:hypothetical protein